MKRKRIYWIRSLAFLLSTVFLILCAATAFAQQGNRVYVNGVTVSLIDDGRALRYYNENTSWSNVTVVIHWEDGSRQLFSFNAAPDTDMQRDLRQRAERIAGVQTRDRDIIRLSSKARQISLPTNADLAAERSRKEAEEAAERTRKQADDHRSKGISYFNNGDYDRAISEFTDAIRIEPNNALNYTWRSNSYNSKGDYDRCIADCNQAIRINPNYSSAYNNRGFAYYGKGDYDRAIEDCSQAIRLDPNNMSAYNNRGAYFSRLEH